MQLKDKVVVVTGAASGIGRALVDAAEKWAVAQKVSEVRVRSNVVRERARRFYESIGYRVTKISNTFDKKL